MAYKSSYMRTLNENEHTMKFQPVDSSSGYGNLQEGSELNEDDLGIDFASLIELTDAELLKTVLPDSSEEEGKIFLKIFIN